MELGGSALACFRPGGLLSIDVMFPVVGSRLMIASKIMNDMENNSYPNSATLTDRFYKPPNHS
jgi:hypothetical protein